MRKFLEIYLGFFLGLPLVLGITMYLVGCFMTWSILPINIEWGIVRLYMVLSAIPAGFLSIDE